MRSQKPSDSFDVNTIPILRAVCGGVKGGDVLTCYLKLVWWISAQCIADWCSEKSLSTVKLKLAPFLAIEAKNNDSMGTVRSEQACNAFGEGKVSWETRCQSHLCNETMVKPTFLITKNFSF